MLGLGLDLAYKYNTDNSIITLWTFDISQTKTLSNFSITTTSGNVTINWSDETTDDIVTSMQKISHTYVVS